MLFSLQRSGGSTVWSEELTGAAVRQRLRQGAILLVVPANGIETGRYVLTLRSVSDPDRPTLLEIPLELVRSGTP